MQKASSKVSKEVLDESARIFKILGDPTRLAILNLLSKQELNVSSISYFLEMEQSAISHQLKLLKSARLVKVRRDGRSMFYSQNDDHVYHILDQVLTHVKEDMPESRNV